MESLDYSSKENVHLTDPFREYQKELCFLGIAFFEDHISVVLTEVRENRSLLRRTKDKFIQ